MQYLKVPIKDIVVPDVRVTAQYDDEALEKMRGTVSALGLQGTVILIRTATGYEVADGKNRIDRAIELGETEIDAAVTEGSSVDTLLVNLALTKSHGKTKVGDMVRVIGELAQVHDLGPDDIRDKTGLTRDYIERILKIAEASPSVLEALDSEVIGVGHAYELSRLPSMIQQDEVIARHSVWRFTVKELKGQIDDVIEAMHELKENPPHRPAYEPPAPRKVHCEGCLTEAELGDLRSVLVCPGCYTEVWRMAQASRVERERETQDGGGG